ncbi:MAG TPA: methyltransferase domain-containing protein [Pyrinomonadaceae bacterium]|nr:methyltransferase domain-containing protein [Pyrinomonadaceae bacterium]
MNYDETEIPRNYDRGRDHGPELLNLWMNVLSAHVKDQKIETILDLGCGTGRFSETLAAHFAAQVIGIDPSQKMLEQAEKKKVDVRVRYEQGHAESIPLPDGSVDLIFMSMSFHHFEDPAQAARECRRVLRRGSLAFLRGGSRDRISSYACVDFFPASRSIMEKCLPATDFMREVFAAAGFQIVDQQLITQEIAPNYSVYADKLATGADSVLAQLSAADFEAGLKAMRAYDGSVQAVTEPIDLLVFRS